MLQTQSNQGSGNTKIINLSQSNLDSKSMKLADKKSQ